MHNVVSIEYDAESPMRDGTVLRSDIYRGSAGDAPVIIVRTPYGKANNAIGLFDPAETARLGYLVVVQDVRGRGRSDGDWKPLRAEGADGFDSIEWAARLPGANGTVVAAGISYAGMAALHAAAQKPPSLRAVSVVAAGVDGANGYFSRGGAFELGLQGYWQGLLTGDVIARAVTHDPFDLATLVPFGQSFDDLRPAYHARPLREFAGLVETGLSPYFGELVDDHMRPGSDIAAEARVDLDAIDVPVLSIGGWYDIYNGDTIATFEALHARNIPTGLIIGPWAHGSIPPMIPRVGDVSFPNNFAFVDDYRTTTLQAAQLQWFTRWLNPTQEPVSPNVRWYTVGDNAWRESDAWPPPGNDPWTLFLGAPGLLQPHIPEAGKSCYDFDPADPVPTTGGNTLLPVQYVAGPVNQRAVETRADVLVFTSPTLEQPITVTGRITVDLWAITSAVDTDFVARLCDVNEEGRSINIADGIIRASYATTPKGGERSLVQPGETNHYLIDLWATSITFKTGHQVRLQITSSSSPRWDVNLNNGEPIGESTEAVVAHQQILHGPEWPSALNLPRQTTAAAAS